MRFLMASKKKKREEKEQNGSVGAGPSSLNDATARLANLFTQLSTTDAETPYNVEKATHRFWNTQPVVSVDDQEEKDKSCGSPIEQQTVEDIKMTPYPLIPQFEWTELNLQDPSQMDEVYNLLKENYVEDVEATFRFSYSRDFLQWALLPPGWRQSWHLGVRVKASGKLVGFITAIPATVCVWKEPIKMVEINFLCIHKKLRLKRLAPVLIQEITRRVNLTGIFQAIYTAGVVIPTPVTHSQYYHRSLNPKKLIEIGFSRLAPRTTLKKTIKLYALKPEPATPGIRLMESGDIPQAYKLLKSYLQKFQLRIDMSEAEFSHWLTPREEVLYTYVVEDPKTHEITDLTSFYALPSSVIRNPKHNSLKAAYMFFHVPLETDAISLMRDALILARSNKFDVFNALDLAENNVFFEDLHFLVGDGSLHYYLYNWKCPRVDKRDNAVVLV